MPAGAGSSVNVLLLPHGTDGDVHPFVGLGIALRERNHRITLMANEHFKPLATDNGFRFVSIGTAAEYQQALRNPDLHKKIASGKNLARSICKAMPIQYQAIRHHYEPSRTVVVASGAAFGARIAHEKLGVPMATVVLQPAVVRSAHKMPVVAGAPSVPTWLPLSCTRSLLWFLDRILDRIFCIHEVNAFRASLALPPVRSLVKDWWLSPQRVIALFPDWFGLPQPDWPAQIRMTGFPLYDKGSDARALPGELQSFLDAGPPPVVVAPGSGMMCDHTFFEVVVRACQLLGRRGILLTPYTDQLPRDLPASVRHFDYIPFSQLLPHAAVIIHHGGVGTAAQAMAAAIPHLVIPMVNDQPDNAARIKSLGVGDWLRPRAMAGPAVSRKLRYLIESSEVAARCRTVAQKVDKSRALQQACELIEELGNGDTQPTAS